MDISPADELHDLVFEILVDAYQSMLLKKVGLIKDGFLVWPIESYLNEIFYVAACPYTREVYELTSIDQNPHQGIHYKRDDDLLWIFNTLSNLMKDLEDENSDQELSYLPSEHLFEFLEPSFVTEELARLLRNGGALFKEDIVLWYLEDSFDDEGVYIEEPDTYWYAIDTANKVIYEIQTLNQDLQSAVIIKDEDIAQKILDSVCNTVSGGMEKTFSFDHLNPNLYRAIDSFSFNTRSHDESKT